MPKKIEHIFDDNGIELKRCSDCHEYLPLQNFGPSKATWDKLNNRCKICHSKYNYDRAKKNLEQYREYQRVYFANKHATDPEFRHKQNIRNLTNNAIRNGKLIKPEECELCHMPKPLHAHHESYEFEDILNVVFLCPDCHSMVHVLKRKKEALENDE